MNVVYKGNTVMTPISEEDKKAFFKVLRQMLDNLTNPQTDIDEVREEKKAFEQRFAIPHRRSNACFSDMNSVSPITVSSSVGTTSIVSADDITKYNKAILFKGSSDPLVEVYSIAEQTFFDASKRMHGIVRPHDMSVSGKITSDDTTAIDTSNITTPNQRKKALEESFWRSKNAGTNAQNILELAKLMHKHGIFETFMNFMRSEDCLLPRKVKDKFTWADNKRREQAQKIIRQRRFDVVTTDGMAPSEVDDSKATNTNDRTGESGTSPASAKPGRKASQIPNLRFEAIESAVLLDPALKSNPLLKHKTESLPAPKHGTAEEDIDPRQTYLYRKREATYTWYHVERERDDQWVHIGISSDPELPVYVCMHDQAVDPDQRRVITSVDKLRANVHTQIMYPGKSENIKAFLLRLNSAIHIDKADIAPKIHTTFNWQGRPNVGFALINSIVSFIQATGRDPKTNGGIILHGDSIIDIKTGFQTSLKKQAEWHTASAVVNRGGIQGFECVKSLAEMTEVARYFMAHASGQANIPVLNPNAREKVYKAPTRALKAA